MIIYCAHDSNALGKIRTSRHSLTCVFYTEYILLALRMYFEGSGQVPVAESMNRYTIAVCLPILVSILYMCVLAQIIILLFIGNRTILF